MAVEQSDLPQTYGAYVHYQLCRMRHNIPRIYQIAAIRKWSIWWALTTCMSLQVFIEYTYHRYLRNHIHTESIH